MNSNSFALVTVVTLACALVAPPVAMASHGVPLVSMSQRDPAQSNAVVSPGGVITGSQIGFQVSSDSPTCGASYFHQVQFEVVPTGAGFTGAATFSSSWYSGFKPNCVVKPFPQQNYTPPSSSGSYRWQVRERTSTNGGGSISSTGAWTDFGGNGTNADFISNQPPVAEANGPYSGTQGVAVSLSAVGSSDPDGSIATYEWDCTDDGTYDTSSATPSDSCTYPDDGVYTARLRVTDDGGSQATDVATVNVPNVGPTAEANGPYTGTKGFAIAVTAVGSSDSDGAINLYEWDCDADGSYELSSATPTGNVCTFAAVGSYTVTLQVTDDDGGTATDTASVTVGNDPPTADAGSTYAGNEGSAIPLDGSGSADVGGGAVAQWEWDCTDDGVYDVTASSATGSACTYTDDAVYTVRLRVTDDDGATAQSTATATIGNVAPSITSATGPATGDEGSVLTFASVGDDVGTADIPDLVFTWSWGDGTADGTGTAPTHAYDDEGTYAITVTLDDQDTGVVTTTLSVDIANVAPVITSTPVTTASEAVQWTYAPIATDPGADTLTWSLSPSAPAAMTIDSATGALAWTPAYADAVAGSASMVLTVDDGDSGTDAQSITLTVDVVDTATATGCPTAGRRPTGLTRTIPATRPETPTPTA